MLSFQTRPLNLNFKLEVEDSLNSAEAVIDAIRCC